MRVVLLVGLLLLPFFSLAQQPAQASPAGSNWSRISALPLGTGIHIKARSHNRNCNYQSSDADSVTCLSNGKPITFQRSDVRAVQIIRRGRSALIGAAPGAAVAAGSGVALATQKCSNQGFINFCGLGPAVGVIFGAVLVPIGAGIGAGTDFAHSTIYKAP